MIFNKIENIIREILSTPPNKKDCGCGCGDTCGKAPILNEILISKSLISKELRFHIDNKKPLYESKYPMGSQEYNNLWNEVCVLYSRGMLDLGTKDKEIITKNRITENKVIDEKKGDSTIYKVGGKLKINTKLRNVTEVLSDIRSLPGITIVKTANEVKLADKMHEFDLAFKVDPHPYIYRGGFKDQQVQELIKSIRSVEGVQTFLMVGKPIIAKL